MERHALIVLTDHFPYAVGDEFFEQEIDILAEQFDKVYVVPVLEHEGAVKTRKLPQNVESRLVPATFARNWKWHAIKWTLPLLTWYSDMIETRPWNSFMRWILDMRFASTSLEFDRALRRVIPAAELAEYDTVTIYSYWFYTGAAVGALWKKGYLRKQKVQVYSRAHAYDVDEDDTAFGYLPGRPFMLSNLDQVWPISEYAYGQLKKHCPEYEHKLAIRRLGVPPMPIENHSAHEVLRIVSCSHMAEYKRVDLLVDTIAELGRRGVPVRWTHIGEFNLERLERMKTYAQKTISGVEWEMVGRLDNQQVHDLYMSEDFDVFVNTSSSEGVPVSIMEAFAAGLPVVATAAGGTEEIVHDAQNGFIVPVETTPVQIADAIERVRSLGASAYKEMAQQAQHTWEMMANARKQYADLAVFLAKNAHANR